MDFVCVVCSQSADVYCHNDNAYLCAACDVVVHSAHALAASHHRTPVQCHIHSTDTRSTPADAVSHSIIAAENPQLEKDVEPSFDADDWFAVPDVVTGDAKEVQSGVWRGRASENKLGLKKREDSLDFDFNCVPWDIALESDPLDIPFEFPLDVSSIDSVLVPSVPASPQHALHGGGLVEQEVKSKPSTTVKREENASDSDDLMLPSCDGNNADVQDGIPEIFDPFPGGTEMQLNLDIPAPRVQENVKIVPAPIPVPLHAQSWIQTYVPHTLLPMEPAARASSLSDRRERVARFRAKKNSFHFKKTIRYASRKRYAEKRPRIKGRFARKDEIEAAIKAGVPLVA